MNNEKLKANRRRQLNAKTQTKEAQYTNYTVASSFLDISDVYKKNANNTINTFASVPSASPLAFNASYNTSKTWKPVNPQMFSLTNYAQPQTGIARNQKVSLISDPILNDPSQRLDVTNMASIYYAEEQKL